MEMLMWDLSRAVYEQMPTNLTDVKQSCKEEWVKISPQQCERLMKSNNRAVTVSL